MPLVSIIISNYNYGRFLVESLNSALGQTYRNIEVLVVDDGSTDSSRAIIDSYKDQIVPILKANGGQTSAVNIAFPRSKGEIIFFLDSDDVLLPSVVEKAVTVFNSTNGITISKLHWPLWVIDENGAKNGDIFPPGRLSEGDLRDILISCGPDFNGSYTASPTSGNAWAKTFLERVIPMPDLEAQYNWRTSSVDAHLSMLAPLFGQIKALDEPLGFYRVHGKNSSRKPFLERVERNVLKWNYRAHELALCCQRLDFSVAPDSWTSWYHKLHQALLDILKLTEAGNTFILVDEEQWAMGENLEGRSVVPFLERNNQYWGPPVDDEMAIRELNRLRSDGANFIVFAWPAFWWLDYYADFYKYLRSTFSCLLKNERLIMFDLCTNE